MNKILVFFKFSRRNLFNRLFKLYWQDTMSLKAGLGAGYVSSEPPCSVPLLCAVNLDLRKLILTCCGLDRASDD